MATKTTKEPNPSGWTDSEIKKILKEGERAAAPKPGLLEFLKEKNIAPATYYYWQKKYSEKKAKKKKKKEAA